ncbi:MAG TPA: Xaa-Pro peptidase family protein [Solirubrobacteraceae bacterium]|nr:Xaa-Pro peptidase family protein [Solirubrobacteraceae bacterium]
MRPRAERLASLAADRELDALLVREPVNLRWLTGFTGTNGLAVVESGADGRRVFVTDFRYVERAAEEVGEGFARAEGQRDLLDAVAGALPERRPLRLGFDDVHVSVRDHARLAEALEGVELVAAGGLVERLRAVTDPGEVAAIRAAAALADDALAATLEGGLAGRTERAFALALEDAMRHRGAPRPSFPAIVAAGPHGALPHAEAREAEIPRGALVVVDWGAQLDGYCSDCTRTLATGEVADEALEVYEVVRRAQLAGLDAVRPGPSGQEVDAVARAVIDEAGHGERFGHGLGHGVGLEIHEDPRLSKAGEAALEAGNVVTVEPGVYLPGRFGVRIEDLVVVTGDGADVLSSHPKELTVVD